MNINTPLIIKYTKEKYGINPIELEHIKNVERKLEIILPRDFKNISEIYSYEFLGGFNFLNFGLDNEFSVINETIGYRRNVGLPDEYLVLYEDDASAIFMLTSSNIEDDTRYWLQLELL